MLRGDIKTELDYTTRMVLSGLMTRNEARKRAGLPIIPDGDVFFAPPGGPTPEPVEKEDEAAVSNRIDQEQRGPKLVVGQGAG